MKADDILNMVNAIETEKRINRELVFESIETALSKAAGKKLQDIETDPIVVINRETGDVTFYEAEVEEEVEDDYDEETGELIKVIRQTRKVKEGEDAIIPIDPGALGRVAAQTAKQVIIQRLREAERDAVYDEYFEFRRTIVVGAVTRMEGPNYIVAIEGRTEGFFPKWEQVRDESYEVGERIKALILDVKKAGQKVKIILSRTHPDFVRRLFEEEVPEIKSEAIEIKALVREPGYRSKVAVESNDPKIDAVGACVGVRGMRIKGIIEELGGEKIDIIRWSDSAEVLIQNALKPAQVASITLDFNTTRARVVVPDDQLSLAIGRGGQNVRLASRLSGWDIDIMSNTQESSLQLKAQAKFETIEGVDAELAERLFHAGYTKFDEILEADSERLQLTVEGLSLAKAEAIVEWLVECDEDEYYREVEVELPEQPVHSTATQKLGSLFSDDGSGGGEDGGRRSDGSGLDSLFTEKADGTPLEAGTWGKAWVEEWLEKLPASIRETVDGARDLVKSRLEGGTGLRPGDWRVLLRVKGLEDSALESILNQLEDDKKKQEAFATQTTALLAAASADKLADVDKQVAALSDHAGMNPFIASLPAALVNPDAYPVFDWTSLVVTVSESDRNGRGNPLLDEAPTLRTAMRARSKWPVELPTLWSALATEVRKTAHYKPFVQVVREAKGLSDDLKETSVFDISLALWSFGLHRLSRDTTFDNWGFTEEAVDPQKLLAPITAE